MYQAAASQDKKRPIFLPCRKAKTAAPGVLYYDYVVDKSRSLIDNPSSEIVNLRHHSPRDIVVESTNNGLEHTKSPPGQRRKGAEGSHAVPSACYRTTRGVVCVKKRVKRIDCGETS